MSQHQCQILSVGELKTKNNFKSCHVLVKTKELRDEVTDEVVRESGTFDAEVSIKDESKYQALKELCEGHVDGPPRGTYHPCTFMLRSFTYREKDQDKLAKQLQLKRWWR